MVETGLEIWGKPPAELAGLRGRDENSSRPQAPEGAFGIRYGGCPRQVRRRVFPLSSSYLISIKGLRSLSCCSIFISHLLFAPAGV